MPLIFKSFQSQLATKEGDKLFYPRLVKIGKVVTTQKIGEKIAEKTSLTPGDVHNVIRSLPTVLRDFLLDSRTVKLDGLGTFTMIARSGGKGVKKEEQVNSSQITGLRCQFTPEYSRNAGTTTRALTEGVEFISLADMAKSLSCNHSLDDDDDDDDDGGFVDPIG